jgi:threonine dehydratase
MMVSSLRDRRRPPVPQPVNTIADGIAIRVPVPEVLDDLRNVIDDLLLVEDAQLIQAMLLLFQHHGIVSEPAGVAGLAAAIAYKDRFAGLTVATPICGGNLSDEQAQRWLNSPGENT